MTSREDEQRCLQRLAAGEDDWARFAKLFGGFICSECQGYGVRDANDREDVYQLVFIKLLARDRQAILRHVAEYGHNSFLAVLGQVVRSAAIDFQRRKNRHLKRYFDILRYRAREPDAEEQAFETVLERLYTADGNPEQRYLSGIRLHCLFDSLARGVKNQQAYELMHLRYVEGNSVKEIARRLGLKVDAVDQRLSYYRKRLREVHGDELKDLLNDI